VGTPSAGTVILVRFPFSDLSQTKVRPALVLADSGQGDCILCQITSNPYTDSSAIEIGEEAFASGSLHRTSYARPRKIFTTDRDLLLREIGVLKPDVHRRVVEILVEVLREPF
jgi:mRNA interferase MazF